MGRGESRLGLRGRSAALSADGRGDRSSGARWRVRGEGKRSAARRAARRVLQLLQPLLEPVFALRGELRRALVVRVLLLQAAVRRLEGLHLVREGADALGLVPGGAAGAEGGLGAARVAHLALQEGDLLRRIGGARGGAAGAVSGRRVIREVRGGYPGGRGSVEGVRGVAGTDRFQVLDLGVAVNEGGLRRGQPLHQLELLADTGGHGEVRGR